MASGRPGGAVLRARVGRANAGLSPRRPRGAGVLRATVPRSGDRAPPRPHATARPRLSRPRLPPVRRRAGPVRPARQPGELGPSAAGRPSRIRGNPAAPRPRPRAAPPAHRR